MSKLFALLVAFCVVPAFADMECHAQGLRAELPKLSMYKARDSLPSTLLATRQRYVEWLAEQPAARKTVTLRPWRMTSVLSAAEADRLVNPEAEIDSRRTMENGTPLWSEKADLPDGRVVKLPNASDEDAIYLARSIIAERPAVLTIGVGGGDRLDLWLNGKQIASAETHLHVGRYGCSTRVDGTRVDQLIVDLDLQPGENTLVLRATPGAEPSFYFSTTPNPVPRIWEQLRRDFPPVENPLLKLVHADWFAAEGWFAARDCHWEQQFIDSLADTHGDDAAAIRVDLERLGDKPADPNDPGWLRLCVKVAISAKLHGELARLRSAVWELGESYPARYAAAPLLAELDEYAARLATQTGRQLDPSDDATRRLMVDMPEMQHRMLVTENPLLRGKEILFVKRSTYNSKHYYDDFQHISRWGGNLCALSVDDGSVRDLATQLADGIFDRYDLSFDATRIAFGYRRPKPEGYRIYEIGVDGNGLRQLTRPPIDEADRIASYGATSTGDSFYGAMGYRFWTDDVHPCYLPDGGICFASTRCEHGVLCTPNHYLACTNLYRIGADGGDPWPISRGALSEFTPTMMEDGRILYNRWEYVYKGIAAVQPLWITRPDGSGSEEFYGDNIANPGVFWQARQVPGHRNLAVCIGCGHEPLGVGQVLLLDMNREKRTREPMTSLTPNVKTENLRGLYHLRNGVWREDIFGPFYADPFPLSDKFFLVSCNPDRRYNEQAAYGIYLLDVFGNRVRIYHDSEISCWQPMPIEPRVKPPLLPTVPMAAPQPADTTSTVFLSDVYEGLEGVAPGTVKYLRVMEQIPKPWSAEVDPLRGEDRRADGFGGHLAISRNAHIWVAVLQGIVPVDEDGSACFKVPANRNLFFQLLDENYMEVQRMRTFVNFAPGERRSCIGCHERRTQAPVSQVATALVRPPTQLAAQPGEVAPRPLYYPTDVQPILDRHCTACHDGTDEDSKAAPDLTGEMTTLFSQSYEALLEHGLVDVVREWNGAGYAMQNAEAVSPYSHGSHRSGLVQILRNGHYDVKLSKGEWIKLVTWIDCGAPYYGSYFGRRHIKYEGQPDFRPVPTLESARGIAPAWAALPELDPLPAQLLAWWPLDDSHADTAEDATGHNRDCRVVSAVRSEGHDGQGGRHFDGGGYLESPGLGSHEALSIALWVKPETLSNRWNPILFCDDGQPGAVHFGLLQDGTPNVAVNTGDWDWTHRNAGSSLADGKWHHLVLVCDARLGGKVRYFIDGELVNCATMGLGQRLDLYGFRIGAWNRWESTSVNNFHGQLDDIRIYSGTLTDRQVAELVQE